MAQKTGIKSKTRNVSNAQSKWLEVATIMLYSRHIDLIEENELAPAGKIPYQFSSRGHEMGQILLGLALTHAHDGASVYYRSRPFMLAAGFTAQEAFAADMALSGSPSEGRDVGVLYSMKARKGVTVLPASGSVGAQYTPAVGWAQAIDYYQKELGKKEWQGAMAVALGGDGSVASNGFWSALTIATTQKLPMLFFIEDNGYGLSVASDFQTPGGDISKNLKNFANLNILSGSGTAPEECARLVSEAVESVRRGEGPSLLRLEVPRLTGHTFGEDQSAYKSAAQLKEELSRDPLITIKEVVDIDWEKAEEKAEKKVRGELAKAEANANPPAGSVEEHLFADHAERINEPGEAKKALDKAKSDALAKGARINLSEAVRKTMDVEMSANPLMVIFGEDVGVRGGVHRATVGLQQKYGEGRVFDTSLSEEGIIGRAAGMALAGLRPVPEIQFRKYADPATEQINEMGWLRWRTAGKFEAPVVVRIPVGHNKKTGDPWHSVSGEAVYAHAVGWKIAMPSNAKDAVGLMRSALRGKDPTLFLEHRALLDAAVGRRPYPGDDYVLPFGAAEIVQSGDRLTVVSWGEMLYRCLEAAKALGEGIEIIDLRTIIPWDRERVLDSVRKTGKCLIAHEDTITTGFGAEIAAIVAQEAFSNLDAPIKRVATKDVPIPYNIALMQEAIPSIEKLQSEMEALIAW